MRTKGWWWWMRRGGRGCRTLVVVHDAALAMGDQTCVLWDDVDTAALVEVVHVDFNRSVVVFIVSALCLGANVGVCTRVATRFGREDQLRFCSVADNNTHVSL